MEEIERDVLLQWAEEDVAFGAASPATLRAYVADALLLLRWLERERGVTLAEAGDADMRAYRRWLSERFARATVARRLSVARWAVRAAARRGLAPANLGEALRSPRRRPSPEVMPVIPPEGIRELLAGPGDSVIGRRDAAVLALMALQGLRVSEVARADLDDLLPGGRMRVHGKGEKWREVVLAPRTMAAIGRWLEARRGLDMPGAALFVPLRGGGRRLSTRAIRARVDYYLCEAGLKRAGVSCHALRHSYATMALAAGADVVRVSRSLGHASLDTTMIYVGRLAQEEAAPSRFAQRALEEV